jgi:hypothetical protein
LFFLALSDLIVSSHTRLDRLIDILGLRELSLVLFLLYSVSSEVDILDLA